MNPPETIPTTSPQAWISAVETHVADALGALGVSTRYDHYLFLPIEGVRASPRLLLPANRLVTSKEAFSALAPFSHHVLYPITIYQRALAIGFAGHVDANAVEGEATLVVDVSRFVDG